MMEGGGGVARRDPGSLSKRNDDNFGKMGVFSSDPAVQGTVLLDNGGGGGGMEKVDRKSSMGNGLMLTGFGKDSGAGFVVPVSLTVRLPAIIFKSLITGCLGTQI